jgi:hypothetical protein
MKHPYESSGKECEPGIAVLSLKALAHQTKNIVIIDSSEIDDGGNSSTLT